MDNRSLLNLSRLLFTELAYLGTFEHAEGYLLLAQELEDLVFLGLTCLADEELEEIQGRFSA